MEKKRDSLVDRLIAGDRTAAVELVDIYYEQIYIYMRRLGHDRPVSEELTQESFLQAWQHIGQLRDGKALNSWLYRIADNVSRRYWRKNKAKNAVSIEGFDVPDKGEANCSKIEHLEQLGRLRGAIAKLPLKFRHTIILHYMQHLSIAEASEAAGIREGTFKSRLNKALKILRKDVISEKGKQ